LWICEILQELVVNIQGLEVQPFILGNLAYPIRLYFIKHYKIIGQVIIENAFGAFKNQWRILKGMLVHVDKTSCIIITSCVLHNFCELHGIPKPTICDIKKCGDPLIGFDMVNCPCEGE